MSRQKLREQVKLLTQTDPTLGLTEQYKHWRKMVLGEWNASNSPEMEKSSSTKMVMILI